MGLLSSWFLMSVFIFFSSLAEETQQILKVLRSHKAPFAKKRQVMNRVFGDYRFKMTEERKKAEKAGEAWLYLGCTVLFSSFCGVYALTSGFS